MRIKKIASFNVKEGVKSVRYSDLNSGIQYLPADGIINIKSEKVRIAGFGVNESSLYKIDVNGTPYSIGSANSIYLSNAGIITSRSIGGSKGTLSWAMAISDKFGVTVDGTLYAMGGHFAGTIEAKSGKIGTTLINEDGSIVSANGGFRLDANGDLTISHVGGSQLVQDAQTALSTANDAKDKIENAAKFTIYKIDVQYAQNDSNTVAPKAGWSTTAPPWEDGKYMWQQTVTTYGDGRIAVSEPTCISGAEGAPGSSVTLTGYKVQYQAGTSGTTAPTGTWSDTVVSTTTGQFLWTRIQTSFSNGNTYTSYSVSAHGQKGDTGLRGAVGPQGIPGTSVTILSTDVTYQVGGSATVPPSGVWHDDIQQTQTGQYLWTKMVTNFSDGQSITAYSVAAHGATGAQGLRGIQGEKGDQGIPGNDGYSPTVTITKNEGSSVVTITDKNGPHSTTVLDGAKGTPGMKGADGKTSYFHVKYSNDGGKTLTANNGETVGDYIGTRTDFVEMDSTNVADYTWAKIKGETGARGLQGIQGVKGDQGIPGQNGRTSYFHVKYSSVANPTNANQLTETPNTYIGTYVDFTEADSTDPSKYTWTQFKGSQGVKGDQGIAGKNGADGRTSYLHIAYANSADGSNGFDISNGDGKLYIGQYTDFTQADSTDRTRYTWTKIKGEQGPQGVQGAKGVDGKTSYFHIKYSTVAAPISSTQLTETPSTYIGTYVDYTETDSTDPSKYKWSRFEGIKGDQGIPGVNGANGKTSYLHVAYANDITGASNFSTTDPTGRAYLGQYTDFTQADSTDYTKYTWSKIKGEQGPQGIQGVKGNDGKTTYFHIKYSSVANPTNANQMTETPDTYIGTYTDFNASDSSDPKAYTWTQFKGSQGAKGDQGIPGKNGVDGKTYYLHIAYANSADGSSGFSTTDSKGKLYLGQCTDLNSADPTSPSSYNWSLIKGDKGLGVKAVKPQYYLSTSNSTQAGGSWTETQPAWTSGKYIWTRSKVTWDDNSVTYSDPILANGINSANDKANQAYNLADTANGNASNALNKANSAVDQANAGMNKWLVTEYDANGKSVNTITTIPLLLVNQLTPESTMEYDNAFSSWLVYDLDGMKSGIIFSDELRVAYAITYVKFSADTTVSNFALGTDDGGTLYLNGSQTIRNGSCELSAGVSVTFKKGWNVIEVVVHNYTGPGGFVLATYDSTNKTYSALDLTKLVNFERMDCYCSAFSGQTAYGLAVNAKALETSSSLETVSRTVTDNKNGVKDLMTRTSQVETNITTVSNDLRNLSVGGRNLIIQSTAIDGYRISAVGDNFSDSYHCITDFFVAESSTAYTISMDEALTDTANKYISMAWYAKDKTFIDRPTGPLPPDTLWNKPNHSIVYTSTSETAYCRVSYPKDLAGHIKFEKGNRPTDWSPAPEDVDASISNVANIENTHYSTMTTQYNNQQKTIEGTVTRLGNAENRITTVSNDLSNLSVGGRNLLLGTKNGKGWYTDKITMNSADSSFMPNMGVFEVSQPATGFKDIAYSNFYVNSETDYTLSFYAKASIDNAKVYSFLYDIGSDGTYNDGPTQSTLTTTWKKYIVKWRTGKFYGGTRKVNLVLLRAEHLTEGTVLYAVAPKLELGNKPTDWSPAPEDFENAITEQSTALATYKQTIDQNLAQISSTYQRKDGMSNYATNSSVTSAIDQAKDQINSSVSSNYVKTKDFSDKSEDLETRMSSAEQKITDSAIVSTVKSSHDWSELQENASKLDWQIRTDALDLNSMKTDGRYLLKGGLTNAYSGCSGWQYLIVESVPKQSRVTQTMWHEDGVDNTGYTRKLESSGSWTPWVREANTANAISVINQSSESIKIQANRIDIDGLVTFNNSNNAIANKIADAKTAAKNANTNAENQKYYRIIECASHSNDYPGTGIWLKINNVQQILNNLSRGLNVASINPITLAVEGTWGFDTFAGGDNITNFNSKIAELNGGDHIIVVMSYDASYPSRVADALRSIGGTVYTPGSSYRESYVLIGKSNLGYGNGVERYNPAPASNKWQAIASCRVSENGALMSSNSGSLASYTKVELDEINKKAIATDLLVSNWCNINDKTLIDGSKIYTGTITAEQITTDNIVGTNGWINIHEGTFNFGDKISWDGKNLTINGNGSFSGNISASTGNIGGWVIESNGIYQRNAFGNVSVTTGVGGIGAIGTSDVDFLRVQKSDGTCPFYVHKDGSMYASNANISGTITASNGKIADYTINGAMLVGNNVGLSGTSGQGWAFWAGSNDADGAPFRVGHDGSMYASNATISGTITGSIIKSSNSYWDDGNGHLLGRMVSLDNVTYANGGDDGSSNMSRGIGLFGAYGASADVGLLCNDKNITDSNNWYTGLHLDLNSTTLRQPASQNCKVMLYNGNVKIKSNTGASIVVYDANNAEKINTIGMYGRVLIDDYITFTHPNGNSWHSLSCIQHVNNYLEIIVDGTPYGVSAWLSDKTLKRNISNTRINGSSILRNIEFKQFDWIDTGKHENIGVIAQDVEKIDGNLVLKIKQCDGTYSYQINPNEFATITAKALQEQMTRIDNMEININNKILQTKNDLLLENQKLKDKLSFLEEKVKYMNGEKSSYSE